MERDEQKHLYMHTASRQEVEVVRGSCFRVIGSVKALGKGCTQAHSYGETSIR
jgi:hypothetical protein